MRHSCLFLLLVACLPASAAPTDPHAEVRGVTISCQTWGWEWGSEAMPPVLDRVKAVGGNWVAIHPYARIRQDGSVRARLPKPGEPAPAWLKRPIEWAHARGLKVLIKPHLAYWGSGFSWRGEIRFPEAAARARFFAHYSAWITRLASLSEGADAFCVGTELGGTAGAEQEWRRLIAQVRQRFSGHLTYAANWDRYRKVGFWDALDVIGIQAYFPLVKHARSPSDVELKRGWQRVLGEVRRYSQQVGKQVVFTELGYDCSPRAAVEPWKPCRSRRERQQGAELQLRCLRVALDAIAREERVVGLFLWKAFPGRAPGEDFPALRTQQRPVLEQAWRREAPAGPR